MFYKKLISVIAILSFIGLVIACSEDSNDPSDNDYTLTQSDLDNAANILVESVTGTEYGENVSIPHGGEDLTPHQTIREVLGNININDDVEVGTIIAKRTYLKDDMNQKGDLLVTFAMVKRHDGYYPEGGDWDYYMMPNDGSTDYSKNPNGLFATAAGAGKLQDCAGCHANASGTNRLFIK